MLRASIFPPLFRPAFACLVAWCLTANLPEATAQDNSSETSKNAPHGETQVVEDVTAPQAGPLPGDSPGDRRADNVTPEEDVTPEDGLTPEDRLAREGLTPEDLMADPQPSAADDTADGPRQLRFSFSGATWREVLNWLTEAGELSLYVDQVPPGTFTYSDSQTFTVDEAVARLNLFLLPQGFSLVRRGELLSVISLGDPRSLQQLDAMAKVVPVGQLDELNDHEVVKCFVPLGDIVSSEALDELQPLSLMTTPVVLPRSNQLIITETAKKLRSAVQVLDAMREPEEKEATVQRFDLKHVDADTVLMVAGTHLGIPDDQMSGIDITITTDLTGKRMFAVGSEEKLARLESLLTVIDVPQEEDRPTGELTLVAHPVSGDDLQTVYDVLQTMLADKSLRMSMQESTGSIVALANDEVHQQIRDTIEELRAPSVEFAVVELGAVDPYFAVSLISQMFGIEEDDDDDDWWRRRRRGNDDDDNSGIDPPKVDADPGNRRLFVRGTNEQIEQIEQLVARLGSRSKQTSDMRFVPLTGPQRQELLQTAKQFWQGENRLQILPPAESLEPEVIERSLHSEQAKPRDISTTDETQTDVVPTGSQSPMPSAPTQEPAPQQDRSDDEPRHEDDNLVSLPKRTTSETGGDRFSTSLKRESSTPPIRSQWVPNGLLLQSDDIEALDRFEDHLRQLSSQEASAVSPTVVYYLKYVTADEAVKMLADLLDGANTLQEVPGDTLVSGGGGSSPSYLGSFLYERDGMTTVTAGTATIVSDARLNRLIVQGTKNDIAMIERYMKIVDKDNSIIDVEIAGRSRVIELTHARAAEVAELIRQAFPGRIDGAPAGPQRRPNEEDRGGRDSDRDRDDEEPRRVDEKPTRGSLPTMAVAVHESSNSLVVTAPDSLFDEVQRLVDSVDQRSERSVRVITAGAGVNQETLSRILAEEGIQTSTPNRNNNARSNRGER